MKKSMISGLQKLKQTVTLSGSTPPLPQQRQQSQSREGSDTGSEHVVTKRKLEVSSAAHAVDGGPVFEILSVDPTQLDNENAEPLPYRFTVAKGFKQLIDSHTNLGTNTFVCGQDSNEYLALRGRMTVIDTTMSKIRQQMEWLHQELMVLETEKQDLIQKLHNLPLHDRSCTEFTISIHPPRPVEALPAPDEEPQDLMRRAETTAMSELPHGGEYVILHSGEHACTGDESGSARRCACVCVCACIHIIHITERESIDFYLCQPLAHLYIHIYIYVCVKRLLPL